MDFKAHEEYARDVETRLRKYIEGHNAIYLWGATLYGRRMKKFLARLGYEVDGFVVTGGDEAGSVVEGIPVFSYRDVRYEENPGIILTTRIHNHEAVLGLLRTVGYADCFVPDMRMYIHIPRQLQKFSREEAERYAALYPPAPYRGETVSDLKSVLLICADAIGDEVLNIPFIRELRRNLAADAKIDIVVKPAVAQLMKKCPYIDEVIVYDLIKTSEVTIEECAARNKDFAEKFLRRRAYDAVFIHGWFNIHLECLFLAIFSSAKLRIGYSERNMGAKAWYNQYYDKFLSLAVESGSVMHEVERDLFLLEAMGGKTASKDLEIWVTEEEERYAERILREADNNRERRLIAIAAHAADRSRIWDKQNFIELSKRILKEYGNILFVIVGGKEAQPIGKAYAEAIPPECLLDLTGKTTVGELAAVLKQCDLYIGLNTGPLHIAAAWKIPTVEIISHPAGGNPMEYPSPERYMAWGNEAHIVRPRKALPGCEESCNLGIAHCINQITVDEVFEEAKKAIDSQARKGILTVCKNS